MEEKEISPEGEEMEIGDKVQILRDRAYEEHPELINRSGEVGSVCGIGSSQVRIRFSKMR